MGAAYRSRERRGTVSSGVVQGRTIPAILLATITQRRRRYAWTRGSREHRRRSLYPAIVTLASLRLHATSSQAFCAWKLRSKCFLLQLHLHTDHSRWIT